MDEFESELSLEGLLFLPFDSLYEDEDTDLDLEYSRFLLTAEQRSSLICLSFLLIILSKD
jgi:hypothetical protein